MGRWCGQIFKAYFCKGILLFPKGMLTSMPQMINYVNIEGFFINDITHAISYLNK